MTRIVIRGRAAVFREDEEITDPLVLRSLDGLVYGDERFTDHLDGDGEDGLAAALESGGTLRFSYQQGDGHLTAETVYRSRRARSESELGRLVGYTMAQWSDGIGENWQSESDTRYGFAIVCLTPGDHGEPDDPDVQVIEEPTDA